MNSTLFWTRFVWTFVLSQSNSIFNEYFGGCNVKQGVYGFGKIQFPDFSLTFCAFFLMTKKTIVPYLNLTTKKKRKKENNGLNLSERRSKGSNCVKNYENWQKNSGFGQNSWLFQKKQIPWFFPVSLIFPERIHPAKVKLVIWLRYHTVDCLSKRDALTKSNGWTKQIWNVCFHRRHQERGHSIPHLYDTSKLLTIATRAIAKSHKSSDFFMPKTKEPNRNWFLFCDTFKNQQ